MSDFDDSVRARVHEPLRRQDFAESFFRADCQPRGAGW
jgi:hypothetical protein